MGPELDVKRHTDVAVEISEIKEKKNAIQGRDDRKSDNTIFDMKPLSAEKTITLDRHEDVEINITECTNCICCDRGLVESELRDEIENSSSFSDTVSGTVNGLLLDDEEVESQQCDGNLLEPVYEGFSEEFQMRQKKLTMHWRKFIRPLMWRCKWMELNSKALKYDSELAFHDKTRWFVKFEASDAKSLPLPTQRHRNKVSKRSKRKRIEETLDVASYVLHHNLFSYYEKKKSDGVFVEDFGGNLDKNSIRNDECGRAGGWLSSNFIDGENSMEYILSRIEVVQSEVQKLKGRVDKIVSENPIKFSSRDKLSLLAPSDSPNSPKDENNKFHDSSWHEFEYFGDMLTTGAAVSSLASVPLFSDLIKSADESQVSSEHTEDDMLIYNQAAKDELRDFENVRGQFTDQPLVLPEEQKPDLPVSSKWDDLGSKFVEATVTHEPQPATKSDLDGNKRKRRRRRT